MFQNKCVISTLLESQSIRSRLCSWRTLLFFRPLIGFPLLEFSSVPTAANINASVASNGKCLTAYRSVCVHIQDWRRDDPSILKSYPLLLFIQGLLIINSLCSIFFPITQLIYNSCCSSSHKKGLVELNKRSIWFNILIYVQQWPDRCCWESDKQGMWQLLSFLILQYLL